MLQITGINNPEEFETGSLISDLSNPNQVKETVGLLVSRLLQFSIIIAGLFFLVRLISSGYQYMTSAGDSGKMQNATKELTNALVGLIIVICAYFIAQILEVVFGINILKN